MKKNTINYIVIFISLAVVLFTFFLPKFMIQPGTLISEHSEIETKCFSCHTPFKGVSSEKCFSCHKIDEIGIKSTEGLPITNENTDVSFHQELNEKDCLSCHTDHKGIMAFRPVNQFSHNLLMQSSANKCNSCHTNPSDALHTNLTTNCMECHTTNAWTPSIFNHEKFLKNNIKLSSKQCIECHTNPSDALHTSLTTSCIECHTTNAWTPSTFKHNEYFRLDRDHNAKCVTCHINNNFTQYTCYSCHEHSRSNIRREHIEEGIYNFDNCVECHRSSNEHEAERIWKSMRKVKYKRSVSDNDD